MATTTHLRHINQRKIIRAMMRLRTASRAQLARAAGLSQPTVGRIVVDMLAESVLAADASREEGAANGNEQRQLGRPFVRFALDRRRRRFLAIHVGVHETRMSTLPMAVSDGDQWDVNFHTPPSAEKWAQAVLKAWGGMEVRGIEAIVLSLPGVVDQRGGRVLFSPNLHWTEGVDFAGLLQRIKKTDVLCVQEIRALALGQLMAEPELADFLLVDFGTGVGAAAVIGGKLYESALPLSGELGHTPVLGNDRPCSCGATGCVETLISRNGLVQTSMANSGPSDWPTLLQELREKGLPPWLLPSLDAVATTIAGALNVLGLRQVLITGEFSEIPGIADYFHRAIKRGAMWGRFGELSCRAVRRRRLAGIASVAIEHTFLTAEY